MTAPDGGCRCLIWHAVTDDERAEVNRRIAYARRVGDVMMLPLLIEHLNACPERRAVTA